MASGYTSQSATVGSFTVRFYWTSSYNASTNKSTITVTPQVYNTGNYGGDLWACGYTLSNPGIYLGGSRVYSFDSSWGTGYNLKCPANQNSWTNFPPYTGSISTITVSHNSSGAASTTVRFLGTIVPINFESYKKSLDSGNLTISFTEPAPYSITYNANGGSGAPGSQGVYAGVTYTLSSTRPTRTGYTFLGWSTSSTATTATYQPGASVTPNGNLPLYAVWSINSYNVSLTAGTDIASVSGGGTYNYNSSVTVNAVLGSVPGYTYAFDGWYDGSTKVSSNLSYTFTMPASAVSLTAVGSKTPNDYTLSLTAGDYIDSVSGGGTKTFGDSVTVEAVLDTQAGYTITFDGWYNGGTKVSSSQSYTFTYNTADDLSLTAKATRTINSYALTLTKGDYIASVSGGGTKVYDSSVTAVAVLGSASGYTYTFDGWYNGATKVSSSLSYTFNMPASALSLTAKGARSIIPYALSISAGTGTTITVNRTSSPNAGAATGAITAADPVYYGDVLAVTFTANTGYDPLTRTINGNSVAATVNYTVTGATTVAATAEPHEYTLALSISNSGVTASVLRLSSPIGGGAVGQIFNNATLYYGDEILVSFDTGLGYQVDVHTINGVDFDSGDTYTVSGDTTIVVMASATGFVYINNRPYLAYIGSSDGSEWKRYQAQVGDGSNWIAH